MTESENASVVILGGSNQICLSLTQYLPDGTRATVVSRNPRPVWFPETAAIEWTSRLPDRPFDFVIATGPLGILSETLAECQIRCGMLGFSSMSAKEKLESISGLDRQMAERLQAGEAAWMATGEAKNTPATVFRPTMIYGRGLDQNLTRMAAWIRAGRRLPVCCPTGLRQPVHVDDLAKACVSWMANPHPGLFETGGGERLAYEEMACRVFESVGRRPRFFRVPRLLVHLARSGARRRRMQNVAMLLRMATDLVADNRQAAEAFGFAPRAFRPTAAMWTPPEGL